MVNNLKTGSSVRNTISARLRLYGSIAGAIILIVAIVYLVIYFSKQPRSFAAISGTTIDSRSNAWIIHDLNHWNSGNAAFTTAGATPDGNAGSCWSDGPNNNVWFSFQAIFDTVSVQLLTGGAEGSLQWGHLMLTDSSGNELACAQASSANQDISLQYNSLTTGQWYYISVDNDNAATDTGTFTLTVNNVSQVEYYAIANGNWNSTNTWSTQPGGAPAGSVPGLSNVVHIQNYKVTVKTTQQCAALIMQSTANNDTKIDVKNTGHLTVSGNLAGTKSGGNSKLEIKTSNSGILTVGGNLDLVRTGGSKELKFQSKNNSQVTVNGSFKIEQNGGTNKKSQIKVNDNAVIHINGSFTLTYNSGTTLKMFLYNNTKLYVDEDFNFSSATAGNLKIQFNNNSSFYLGGNLVRGTSGFGRLLFNNNAMLVLNGSSPQSLAGESGQGGDFIQYRNVTISNNSNVAHDIILGGPMTIYNILDMSKGVIRTTSANLLTIANGATVINGSDSGYIDGPVKRIGSTAFVFPVGEAGVYAPIEISAPGQTNAAFTAEYFDQPYSTLAPVATPLVNVSDVEYWQLNRNAGSNGVQVKLYWFDGARSGISNPSTLVVAYWNGSSWVSTGPAVPTGNASAGTIQSLNPVSNFGVFTFGSTGGNTLPIQLQSFNAYPENNDVKVTWSTAMELNNDYFAVERSTDGVQFEEIGRVDGAGNSSERIDYEFVDTEPLSGLSYYRLRQVDFNGQFELFSPVAVKRDQIASAFTLLKAGPNPFTTDFQVEFSAGSRGVVHVSLFSLNGELIYSSAMNVIEGSNFFHFNRGSDLPAGTYILSLQYEGAPPITTKLIKAQ